MRCSGSIVPIANILFLKAIERIFIFIFMRSQLPLYIESNVFGDYKL